MKCYYKIKVRIKLNNKTFLLRMESQNKISEFDLDTCQLPACLFISTAQLRYVHGIKQQ